MKDSKTPTFAKNILHFLGILVCVLPPLICTLLYFPLWKSAGAEYVISGGAALLLLLSVVPLYKYIRKLLESAASYILWLIIFLFCFLLSKVIAEVTVIAFVGFVSNLAGAVILKIGDFQKMRNEK